MLRKFVFVSSLVACGPSAEGLPVPADQENPNNAYGRSKLAAEKVVHGASGDMPSVILRPGAIYGPRDGEIFELFQTVNRGLLPLVGGGGAKGSWVYATDCADACIRAIEADVPSGSRYFVDDGTAITQKQLFADIEKALGRRALVRANLPRALVMGVARGVETLLGRSREPGSGDVHPREGGHAHAALGVLVGGHPQGARMDTAGFLVGRRACAEPWPGTGKTEWRRVVLVWGPGPKPPARRS